MCEILTYTFVELGNDSVQPPISRYELLMTQSERVAFAFISHIAPTVLVARDKRPCGMLPLKWFASPDCCGALLRHVGVYHWFKTSLVLVNMQRCCSSTTTSVAEPSFSTSAEFAQPCPDPDIAAPPIQGVFPLSSLAICSQ